MVCPDVVGRGRVDWLADPTGYTIPDYVADMVTLLARLDARSCDWVGTSMGGLIGLGLASLAGTPVGGWCSTTSARRSSPKRSRASATYLGLPLRWRELDEAADYLLGISQGFGPHTREQWLALTRPHAARRQPAASCRTTTRRSPCRFAA